MADHSSMASTLLHFFRSHLGTVASSNVTFDFPLLFGEQIQGMQGLSGPFLEAELRAAVFDLAPDKAPGPDGFPMMFYQRYWAIVKDDLIDFFHSFFEGGLDLSVLNKGWICLVPKKAAPLGVRGPPQ